MLAKYPDFVAEKRLILFRKNMSPQPVRGALGSRRLPRAPSWPGVTIEVPWDGKYPSMPLNTELKALEYGAQGELGTELPLWLYCAF